MQRHEVTDAALRIHTHLISVCPQKSSCKALRDLADIVGYISDLELAVDDDDLWWNVDLKRQEREARAARRG